MKNLYMISLGGKAQNANIEVHDVQFIIAKNIEETFEVLRNHWYGSTFKLHIDAYKVITEIPGYRVSIEDSIQENTENNRGLYFINIGSYNETIMQEIHHLAFVVSDSSKGAKAMATAYYTSDMKIPHVDNELLINEAPLLNQLYPGYIHLTPMDVVGDLKPDWFGYMRIDQ